MQRVDRARIGEPMENIVRALLHTAAFLELSGDESVDPDAAVQALEQMSQHLRSAGQAEWELIARVANECANEERSRGTEGVAAAAFFATFAECFGLDA